MTEPPTFTERESHEAGFAAIFEREIAPKLAAVDERRLALRQRRKQRIIVTVAAAAAAAVIAVAVNLLLIAKPGFGIAFGIWIVMMVGGGGYWWVSLLEKRYREILREVIIGPTCRFLGNLEYSRKPGDRFDHLKFTKLGLIGGHGSKKRVEDLFVGRHRGTDFKMVEISITSSNKHGRSTIFNGLLFEIAAPFEFSCRVIIGRDSGPIGNALGGFFKRTFAKQERVKFDHAVFEQRYEVYSDSPEEAYRLVTPGFCKTMVDLAEAYEEDSLSAAFVDNAFLLALPIAGNLFELGSIKRPAHECEQDIHDFMQSITIAHDVIDYLHGDRPA